MKSISQATLICVISLLLLSACQTTDNQQKPTILLGDISYSEVVKTYPYFQTSNSPAQEQAESIEKLKAISESTHLTVFFGVWCHDSIREVPELMRLLDEISNPNISYQLIALDMKKQEPQGRAKANDIIYTPTIIVSQAGKELGRIIEKPEQDLATDLVNILH